MSNQIKHNVLRAASSSTWPKDVLGVPKELSREREDHLICFLACSFEPRDKANDLLDFVQTICNEIGKDVLAKITCIRADLISTPGTIHADIWKYLELADALIFDVTEENGNVLLELGVAATCRNQDNVIIVRDKDRITGTGKFLFDIAPSRHILYNRSFKGAGDFKRRLKEALLHALTPAPYIPDPKHEISFPFEADLSKQGDSIDLLSPPMLHRRLVDDGLEFGSLFVPANSWMSVGRDDHAFVELEAIMRFSDIHPERGKTGVYMGIALRSQHFYANYSHLVYVRPDGKVLHTEPRNETDYEDVEIGNLKSFDPTKFISFRLNFGKENFSIQVDNIPTSPKIIDLRKAPYIRHAGKIRIQTYCCRAVLKSLKINISK